jgi:hypothetical protein
MQASYQIPAWYTYKGRLESYFHKCILDMSSFGMNSECGSIDQEGRGSHGS